MTWRNHLMNVPIAIFIGFCIGIGFSWWLGADISKDAKKYGTFALSAAATLIAAGIALATAIWNTEDQRERRLRAAKAMLPLALTSAADSCRRGAEISLGHRINEFTDSELTTQILPSDTIIAILKENIQFASPDNARALTVAIATQAKMIARFYSKDSFRTKKHVGFDSKSGKEGLAGAIRWAEAAERFEKAASYARGETDTISTTVTIKDLWNVFELGPDHLNVNWSDFEQDAENWKNELEYREKNFPRVQ